MTARDIIRGAIPDATDTLCNYILWERTCYPVGTVTPQTLYRAAARYRRGAVKGLILCELCDRLARPGWHVCPRCEQAMGRSVPFYD